MFRRRRRPRSEIEFGFDSFLDVVANVVGIILRLILVAWVGARSYKAIVPPRPAPPAALTEPAPLGDPSDARLPDLARRREQVGEDERIIRQTEEGAARTRHRADRLEADLKALLARRERIETAQRSAREQAAKRGVSVKDVLASVEELQERSRTLLAEVEEVRKLPSRRKEFRYRTPVSAPVQSEELMFELKRNRVTLVDTGALLDTVRRDLREKGEELRSRWEATFTTSPVGAFRLRYVLERERKAFDVPGAAPSDGNYRILMRGWEAEPVTERRGETGDQALASGSAFRRIIDALDPQQTVVTFWVYPDSFALYRRLRDHLHDRDIVVAGRPLPEGVPVASSRQGTHSRGQ